MSEILHVFLRGNYAGDLTRDAAPQDPSFTYDRAYATGSNIPLSVHLPLSTTTYKPDRVRPYLAGLLPENIETRARWAHPTGADPDDTFALLSAMGLDCPGAIQLCSPTRTEELTGQSAKLVPRSESDIARRLRTLADDPASWTMPEEHWSLGGQQEKFALTRLGTQWYEAHGAAATTHIIKPGIRNLHHQALIEHVTQRSAMALGLATAHSEFRAFEDQWAIVSTRYDRVVSTAGTDGDAGASDIERVHQEDFCQALGRLPERKYEARGGPTLRDMARIADRNAKDTLEARTSLADFLIFHVVAGAPDGHSKNLSLIHLDHGVQVAPLYDLATGLAYDRDDVERATALSVGGERYYSRIFAKQWVKAAEQLGLASELVTARVGQLAEAFPSAFIGELENLIADGVPGAHEVAERCAETIVMHCASLLARLT